MKKEERQQLIKSLVTKYKVVNQEMFVSLLEDEGVAVTQATVSRDMNELKLQKVAEPDGSFYYRLAEDNTETVKITKLLRQAILHVQSMEKFVVIKTVPGSAGALGLSLEKSFGDALFTNLTTDDKVLLIFKSEELAQKSRMQIEQELAK